MNAFAIQRTFSYSAEGLDDHRELLRRLRLLCPPDLFQVTYESNPGPMHNLKAEINVPLTMEQIQQTIAQMCRGDVMYETLRQVPAALNSFERTFRPNPYIRDDDNWG